MAENSMKNLNPQIGGARVVHFHSKTLAITLMATLPGFCGETSPAGPTPPKSWPLVRGNALQTGVSQSELAGEPAVLWKAELGEAVGAAAAIVDGVVYVGCDDGNLYALDLADGKKKWSYKKGGPIQAAPSVIEGKVIVGDEPGVLHAVEAKTGTVAWTFETEGQIISSANFDDGKLVFGSYDGFVYALDARDGSLLWKHQTEGRVHGTPAIAEGHVIAAGCDDYLHVLALSDGREIRKVAMGSVSGSSAAILGSSAFVGTFGNQVRGIHWRTGKTLWVFEDSERQFPFVGSAAVTPHVVVIGGRDKRLRAFEPETGQVRWTFSAKGRIDSSPVIVGPRVFVGSSDGNVYAVDLESGAEKWRFETGGPITASPAVGERCLVIGNQDGVLYCFR